MVGNAKLDKKTFFNGMTKLNECFFTAPVIPDSTISRYWEYLSLRFDDKEFNEMVEEIILKEKFFPAISTFISRKRQTLMQKAF